MKHTLFVVVVAILVLLMLGTCAVNSCTPYTTPTESSANVILRSPLEINVTNPVEFSWNDLQGASEYWFNIRGDDNFVTGTMEGGYVQDITKDTNETIDLSFMTNFTPDNKYYWGVCARDSQGNFTNWSISSFFWQPTSRPIEQPHPTPPLPANEINLSIDHSPQNPIADGKSTFAVIVAVKDNNSNPVQGANIRFDSYEYVSQNGKIYGGNEWPHGSVTFPCPSGYVMPDNYHLSNLIDVVTDSNGQASAYYRAPTWENFMADKPIVIGAWYDVDGGGNPYISQLVYFKQYESGQQESGGGKIAFASDRDGDGDIYVMNADGSNQTRLTSSGDQATDPTWSPDSRLIAFSSGRGTRREIYVMNADGSNQTRLTNNDGEDINPTWSPDGTKIAFASNRDGNYKIYVMNANGNNQTRLTSNDGWATDPTWSPDGTKIAFASDRDRNWDIYVMNADGSNQTRLTNNDVMDREPTWSHDSTKIAFASNRDGNNEIYVMNADGSNQTRLTNNDGEDINPTWSPDGKKIAFTSDRDGKDEIYAIDADGSNQTRLTNNPTADSSPAWSPQ